MSIQGEGAEATDCIEMRALLHLPHKFCARAQLPRGVSPLSTAGNRIAGLRVDTIQLSELIVSYLRQWR